MNESRIEVKNGNKRAVFVRTEQGWTPDWFYQDDRPMLRFKDHEWLSIGHEHPTAAQEAEKIRGGGALFSGSCTYGTVDVPWSVAVRPDKLSGGFVVECTFVPAETIELLEAYSTFETPYEYDGTEAVTTVIGQNPVAKWAGPERVTPQQWQHAVWGYSRPEAVRMTGPCNVPLLCQAIETPGGTGTRYTTVIGDWTVCKERDMYVTPTRTVERYRDDWQENKQDMMRGYKFIVGALNWSSAFAKDPNVIYKGARRHRQRVILDFDSAMPGGSLDVMLCNAWERAAACDMPANGRIKAYDLAAERGVTWQAATRWLRDVFCGDGVPGLFKAGEGIITYAAGTRPKVAGGYAWNWWPQWAGGLHYRALLWNDAELQAKCDEFDALSLEYCRDKPGTVSIATLPSIWWLSGPGGDGPLAETIRMTVQETYEKSVAENGKSRLMDFGGQATYAAALLLSAGIFGEPGYKDQALLLLGEINAQLDDKFWWFGNTRSENMFHGGQIRPMGHGNAAVANWLAWKETGREEHLVAARRFARFLLAINYVTHDNSGDPDFDWRGWANGTNAGRDQYAEFPPWETSQPLVAIAGMMDDIDLESGFYDVLWYFARTALAQFPAARTRKRILDEAMVAHFVARDTIGSERDFYDVLPYLAYENPHDQTLLASYQGTDCLMAEPAFCNGLAKAHDVRLGVIVPQAALMAESVLTRRTVHVWNPTRKPIDSTITVIWPDGQTAEQCVTAPGREVVKLQFSR